MCTQYKQAFWMDFDSLFLTDDYPITHIYNIYSNANFIYKNDNPSMIFHTDLNDIINLGHFWMINDNQTLQFMNEYLFTFYPEYMNPLTPKWHAQLYSGNFKHIFCDMQ